MSLPRFSLNFAPMNARTLEKLKTFKTFIFDIDGVLTTGNVLVTEEGHMLRSVNIKDGFALQHAVKQGYNIAIISGGNSQGMLHRFQGLGIKEVYLGQNNKMAAFEKVCSDFGVNEKEVAYMGDDMPDLEAMQIVSIAACPSDAATDIKAMATYKAIAKGGEGCAREVIEKTLKLNDHWDNDDHIQSK